MQQKVQEGRTWQGLGPWEARGEKGPTRVMQDAVGNNARSAEEETPMTQRALGSTPCPAPMPSLLSDENFD